MADLASRFRILDGLELPAGLQRLDQIQPRPGVPDPSPQPHRVLVAVVALAIGVMGTALVVFVFRPSHQVPPVSPPSPPLPITTGVTPPLGSIVFDSGAGRARSELAFTTPGGSGSTLMTNASSLGLVAGQAAWSSDGSKIAFIVGHRDSWKYTGDGDLYVMRADGSDLHRLVGGIGVTSPTWSPDGTRIAFIYGQGNALATINVDGSGMKIIAKARGYYQLPRWSPRGDLIAYQSDVQRNIDRTAIFTVRPDGTHEHLLTTGAGFPAWSPDGRHLAYSAGGRLMVLDLATGRSRPLTRCALPRCVSDFAPAWSPDGTRIAFVRQEDGGAATDLYVVDLTTRRVLRLASPSRTNGNPSWHP